MADLACGHTVHMRHRPPFETREWVLTEHGRSEKLGAKLPCKLCRMPRIPSSASEYKRTAIFEAATTPAALLQGHTTKDSTWGEIVVVEGRVLYVIEDEADAAFMLRPGVPGSIAPQMKHHVEPQPGARFFVRFLR